MLRQFLKLCFALLLTALIGVIMSTALGYANSAWTTASMEQARQNMGDQVALRSVMRMWSIAIAAIWLFGLALILSVWYLMYRKQLSRLVTMMFVVSLLISGCWANKRVVLITPPNYGLVINLSDTTQQVTGNSNKYDNASLMKITTQEVSMIKCAINSTDRCPDKLIVEIPGEYVTRIYSKDTNSGTSATNQALCFEAKGANGCVDFTVTAIILEKDIKCYPNLMGTEPVKEADNTDSRFHRKATPLEITLDGKIIGIASELFSKRVAETSPLTMALEKYDLFDEVRQQVIDEMYKQTCVTITNMGLNSGIEWSSPEIQSQIDEATVLANQIELVAQANNLQMQQTQGLIERAKAIEAEFGLAAAIEFIRIQKWDGSFLPALPGAPAVTAIPVATPVPTVTP